MMLYTVLQQCILLDAMQASVALRPPGDWTSLTYCPLTDHRGDQRSAVIATDE
jgi:hypothetical protein